MLRVGSQQSMCCLQQANMVATEQMPHLRKTSSWSVMRGNGDIPPRQHIKALLAISLGTIMMSYDVTVYTQLSKTMGRLFFPAHNPSMQAIGFWGIFFVGFVSRPVGAVLFGHLGDTRGRSTCLLMSVLVMGIPTVLIGCLPVYEEIGSAAPILLGILSLIQGLATGGESGASKVYLHEIADTRSKAVTGSLNYISMGLGVVLGILMVAVTISLVPEDGLAVWGWRLPFLLGIVTLLAAALLRSDMPVSAEFATNSKEFAEDCHKRQNLPALQTTNVNSNKDILCTTTHSADGCSDAAGRIPTLFANKDVSTEAFSGADMACDLGDSSIGEAVDVESQASLTQKNKSHYVPMVELLRGYWLGIALQIGYQAWIASSFYLAYSWLPSFYVTYLGLPTTLTLWMVLTSMVIFTFVVPIAGILTDRGALRPLTATIAICVVAAGVSVPMFLVFQTKNVAACWLLQIVSLCMTAYTMGVLPVVTSNIYPAGVRISGVNLGHNIGMTVFGGLTPLVITAIQHATGSIFIGPGLWMTGMAIISITCSVLLSKLYPPTNQVA